MARVTVEDCVDHIENRFDLVLLASKRARQITMGSDPLVDEDNDKPTVLALREIADGKMSTEIFEAIVAKEAAVEEEALDVLADSFQPPPLSRP